MGVTTVAAIVPALNEEAAIGAVVRGMPRDLIAEVIVVDNGSTDKTAELAELAGARVISASQRGYGRACLAGFQAAQADYLVFLDGDGSFDPGEMARLIQPLRAGTADLVLGSRELGGVSPRAMLPHQRLGNRLVAWLVRRLYQVSVTDIGPYRAVRRSVLESLAMQELTYGWNIEMVVKCARRGLRIVEVPVSYGERMGGVSKVSGTISGTILAGYRMLAVTLRYALMASPKERAKRA